MKCAAETVLSFLSVQTFATFCEQKASTLQENFENCSASSAVVSTFGSIDE
jgi:hypothetical protein